MIRLTRLNRQQIILNADLIKFVENNPDTVITLVNGDKILVHETADQVVSLVVAFRRDILNGLSTVGSGAAIPQTARGNVQADRGAPYSEDNSRG
ncbi:MAG: flagellar FlbD family protein [Terriglobales bacterium]